MLRRDQIIKGLEWQARVQTLSSGQWGTTEEFCAE